MHRFSRRLPMSVMLRAPIAALAWPLVSSTPTAGAAALGRQSGDFADAGLMSPTEFESPNFDYSVEWDRDWAVNPTRGDPVLWHKLEMDRHENLPLYADTSLRYERLDIWNSDLDARFRVIARHFRGGVGGNAGVIAATANAMSGRATTLLDIRAEIEGDGEDEDDVNEKGAVVHRHALNDGATWLAYNEIAAIYTPDPIDQYEYWVQLIAPEDLFEEAFERASADIASDLFEFGDIATIDDILDAAAAEPVRPASDWGITSETNYTGPMSGIPIEWASSMTTRDNLGRVDLENLSLARKYGPYNDNSVVINIYENDRDYTAEYLVTDTARAMASREVEILIQGVEGNHGVLLSRGEPPRPYVSYEEFFVSDDGAFWGVAKMGAPLMEGDAYVFGRWFGPLAGSVTVNGQSFGEFYNPAAIIAAAQSPLPEE